MIQSFEKLFQKSIYLKRLYTFAPKRKMHPRRHLLICQFINKLEQDPAVSKIQELKRSMRAEWSERGRLGERRVEKGSSQDVVNS